MSAPVRRLVLHAGGGLASALGDIHQLLGGAREALFIPFALRDHDGYTATMQARYFDQLRVRLTGLQAVSDPAATIAAAAAIVVGGGNTFRLLKALEARELLEPIRRAVAAGTPYLGSSAGANVGSASIRTTNDMPIVQPRSFDALGLVPFQVNPHYIDSPPGTVGETRQARLREFLEENDVAVVGLREESWLLVEGDTMTLRGTAGAVLMRRGRRERALKPGADLSALLRARARFDVPT